ncbi:acyl-ACP desaturase [Candidatus Jorgensenbacteria bacterium]|nr:acyl-ACP desaturase [Candidatus Jorgensenbacteria bacterium]
MKNHDVFREQFEVLSQLEPTIRDLTARHIEKRTLWFSSDFLPASERNSPIDEEGILKLRERAKTLPDAVRVSLDLNLRTEEGLPHFHRIISVVSPFDSALGWWNNLWTAEEDRHGNILRDYVRDARLYDFRELEQQQFDYLLAGFQPAFVGRFPFETFVYTTVQEKATQLSHERTGLVAGNYEPTLAKILKKIAGDEARHYAFYLNFFKAILGIDPDGALVAAGEILPHIDMPGISSENFKAGLEVEAKLGIYTLWHYKEVVERVIHAWGIESITGLKTLGEKAQENILAIPKRLESVAKRLEYSFKQKTFAFKVLYDREFILDDKNIPKP